MLPGTEICADECPSGYDAVDGFCSGLDGLVFDLTFDNRISKDWVASGFNVYGKPDNDPPIQIYNRGTWFSKERQHNYQIESFSMAPTFTVLLWVKMVDAPALITLVRS